MRSHDEDASLVVEYLLSLPTCTGRIGSTGMCLGGHLALRAAFHPKVTAAVSFFGTDIHQSSLGPTELAEGEVTTIDRIRAKELKEDTEVVMIFGTLDPHVPPEGRDLIRAEMRKADVKFSFWEIQGAMHAFVRDEGSKGRYDPVITGIGFNMLEEVFERRLKTDLGEQEGKVVVENVC